MKFVILNGSPKAQNSVTIQSIKYIEYHFPKHQFDYIDIVRNIKNYEVNQDELISVGQRIQDSDGVLWAFPVYHTTVPAPCKRFIELINEKSIEEYFENKYTAVFSTSIHYADNIAHNYLRAICEDLNMKYTDYLSHDMNDLLRKNRQQDLLAFFNNFVTFIQEGLETTKLFTPSRNNNFIYESEGLTINKVETSKRIIVITDATENDLNIKEMINTYLVCFKNPPEVINLNDVDIKGHCLGCCKCAANNICAYHGKDKYREFLDYVIANADIIIYAATITDRHLSARFKLYYDRSFCYTHIPFLTGKHIGYMISGNLSEHQNLRQSLEMYTGERINLIGFVSDESNNSSEIDKQIYSHAKMGVIMAEQSYFKPSNFIGIAAENLFVEAIKGNLGGIFTADYRYYRKNGLLKKTSLREKLKGATMRYFMSKKAFRESVQKNMIKHMISGHQKVLDSLREVE